MDALLKKLEGPVRRVLEKAVQRAKSRAQFNALVTAIEAGNIDAIMLAAGYREGMWSVVTEQIRTAYAESGLLVMAADLSRGFELDFDINNPRAEGWLRNNSSQLITRLKMDQRSAIQEILQSGMAKGSNPRTTALDIAGRIGKTGRRQGGVVGLNQQQVKVAERMSGDLLGIHITPENKAMQQRYFSRKLRDRRFDAMVRRAIADGKPLPQKARDKIVGRYKDRLLKHRGDTIARTETLAAINAASDEALHQVVEEGLAPRNAVIRIWRHSYSADERPGHLMMSGQERGLDEMFVNPLTFAVLPYPGSGPGSEVFNCRCYIEHKIEFVAVELAAC